MSQHPVTLVATLTRDAATPSTHPVAKKSLELQLLHEKLDAADPDFGPLLTQRAVHFMSFFVIPGTDAGDPAYVVFELTSDLRPRALYSCLTQHARRVLERVFDGCDGFEPGMSARHLQRFLGSIDQGAEAFFNAFPGRGVTQILEEQQLRTAARTHLTTVLDAQPAPLTAARAWAQLQKLAAGQPSPAPGPARPWYVRWSLSQQGIAHSANPFRAWLVALLRVLLVAAALGMSVTGFGFEPGATGRLLRVSLLLGVPLSLAAALTACVYLAEAPRRPSSSIRSPFGRFSWLVTRSAARDAWNLGTSLLLAASIACLLWTAPTWLPLVWPVAVWLVTGLLLIVAWLVLLRAAGRSAASLALLWPVAAGCGLWLTTFDAPQWAAAGATWITRAPASWMAPGFVGSAYVIAAGLWLVLLLSLVSYVVLGRAYGLGVGLTLAAGWLGLFLVWHAQPLRLLVVGLCSAAGLALALAAYLMVWLVRLNAREQIEREGELTSDLDQLRRVQQFEDHQLQNHLITVSTLKPGRLATLHAVLRAVSLASRLYFVRGDLAGIRTIHSARFLVLPDRRRLLFVGNYDFAFASYLQEFNDVPGVSAVWSNTEGFPRTFFLVAAGARDEQRFKAFARRSQLPSLGWYRAYPALAIADIAAATATREDLRRPVSQPGGRASLRRLGLAVPMSEADCDLALRRL